MLKKHITEQTAIFLSVLKWVFLSASIGVVIGAIVTFFLKVIEKSHLIQHDLSFPYFLLLPFVMVFVVFIIDKLAPTAKGHGTEKVIEAIHKNSGKMDLKVVPIKLIATVLTMFAGGSVGKEGPAAQIGAATASGISSLFKFRDNDRKKIVICGISAGFASVFGTPIAGAIFGVEVLIIGVIMYDVLLPSFIAGFAAYTTTQLLGIEYTYFSLHYYQKINLDIALILKVIIAGVFFGIISDILVTSLNKIEKTLNSWQPNIYKRAFIVGIFLVILGFVFGERYLGLGMGTIKDVLEPATSTDVVPWYAFLLKILTTSLTLSGGGSGGIITPVFFVGATSGYAFGSFVDYANITLFAALGFVSVLSGATNAPIAATIMAVELFGLEIAHYAALSAIISFLITGHRSVFSSQILQMKKSGALDIETGKEVEDIDIKIEQKQIDKLHKIKKRLSKRKKDS